jgi:formylglycine-generating enzyme required for sulfatase activity
MIVGFETVYCFQCKKRLSEKDFQEGAALRIDSQTACRGCSEVFLAQMTAEEQQAVFEQSRITVSSRMPQETPRDAKPAPRQTASLQLPPRPLPQTKKRPVALIAGVGVSALLLVVLPLVLKDRTPTPPGMKSTPGASPAPEHGEGHTPPGNGGDAPGAAAGLQKLQTAQDALQKARLYERDNPVDYSAIARLYEAAIRAAEGTRLAGEALRDRDAAQHRRSQALKADLAQLEKTIRGLCDRKAYGEALHRIETARRQHEDPAWGQNLARLEQEVSDAAQGSLVPLVSRAVDLAKRGNASEAKPLRKEVIDWGVPRYVADFDKALAEAARGGPPLPAAAPPAEARPDPVAATTKPEATQPRTEAESRFATTSLALDLGKGVTMEFVYIKPGTFLMGGESTSEGRFQAVETPKHEVTITKGFYLGTYEVTQAQYETVMGQNPSKSTRDPACPVDNVSWDQVLAFCKKAAEKTGRPVRLPTEAEWEYACRAGTQTLWSHGDDPAAHGDYAWFAGNAGGASHPVGRKKPNPWGLYDMHGNVCERIADFYRRDYYASSPKQDPTGPEGRYANGNNGTTLLRGGTWKDGAEGCTSGSRLRGGGYGVYNNWGFRAALTAPDGGAAAGQ